MKYWLLIVLALWIDPLYAQNKSKSEPYQKQWQRIDSLSEDGQLPKTAKKEVLRIYASAKAAHQEDQMLKAQLYLLKSGRYGYDDDDDTATIRRVESLIAGATGTERLIWHSVAAHIYWDYYESNADGIMERTALAGTPSKDFREWDARQFIRVISKHYTQSLDPAAMKIPLARYEILIDSGSNTWKLIPTLYDLLAFRALSFFERDNNDLPQPETAFELNDPALLAPASMFLGESIKTPDSTSLKWRALRIYQTLLEMHRGDAQPEAYIDADLQRIDFVHANAVFPEKKQAYEMALKLIVDKYPTNAAAAEARYLLLASQMNASGAAADDEPVAPASPNLSEIRIALNALIGQFPHSEGAIHAAKLLRQTEEKTLTLTAEETILPDQPSRILVKYRNVAQAWFRIVKVDAKQFRLQQRVNRDTFYKQLLRLTDVQSFESSLPATADYESHSTELKIGALPPGTYAVISSANKAFTTADNAISYALVQATNLAMVKTGPYGQSRKGFILHRKTGEALPGVRITFYKTNYNNKTGENDYTVSGAITSGADGSFQPGKDIPSSQGYTLRKSGDEYFSQEYFYGSGTEPQNPVAAVRTFFFTDRSIYRPGQTILFKGIMIETAADGRKNKVLADVKTTVTLYDANGQKVSSLDLVTNEYGSVSGSFTAPTGSLTGYMTLRNEHGQTGFSVEEYKRPKFSVSFDTLKGAYALNEQVRVKGFAKAYAGNNIDGATVKYTVKRQANWPFWYDWRRAMPNSSEQDIAHGTATTDAAGVFDIAFRALPDNTIDSATLPVFSYRIHVDVTDGSGETRSGDQSVSAGFRSLKINAIIPDRSELPGIERLSISTSNLNDVFVAAKVTVHISKLIEPGFTPRARLWAMPDQFVMSEEAFRQDFPYDEYKDESKPQSWKVGDEVWKSTFTTTAAGMINVPSGTINKNGWYLIDIRSADKDGRKISSKHYVQLYDPKLEGIPVGALGAYQDASSHEPGERVSVHVISSYKQLHLLQLDKDMVNGAQISQPELHGTYSWGKTVAEEDRGGLSVQWLTIKNNSVYTAEASISVPWSNKDLKLTWETHRDKLQPGAKETWTLNINGARKDKIAAEMVAGLYDASLDAFQPHTWHIPGLWPGINDYRTGYGRSMSLSANSGFGMMNAIAVDNFSIESEVEDFVKEYPDLKGFHVAQSPWLDFARSPGREHGGARHMYLPEVMAANAAPVANMKFELTLKQKRSSMARVVTESGDANSAELSPPEENGSDVRSEQVKPITSRKNLQETAFFFPQLKTDGEGNVKFEFTMPEALTEWKFMALAHTKDLQVGQLTGSVKTQKELMVQPNLPRFLRQGDELTITTKISNLSDAMLNGTATITFVDAQTLQFLNLPFGISDPKVVFSVNKGASTTASWKIRVPESRYEPVIVRITAQSGSFTDGEENMLPVLTNRTLVTETLPLWMNGSGTKSFTFDKLLHSDSSKTLSQYKVTLEYTSNPAWYAVQALPYLMEYPYECAEQTFNRYYANALAAHILDKAPRVKAIFAKWEADGNAAALLSNLSKNQELKSAMLEETPWVVDAKNETEQKHNIALLFNSYKLGNSQDAALKKLEDMRVPDGGFAWFKGGSSDRYITQYIATGIARLQHLGVKDGKADALLNRLMPYLDRSITEDYDRLVKSKATMDNQQIDYLQIQYLYLKSFNNSTLQNTAAFKYYKQQAVKFWPKYNAYIKGMIAVSLNRIGYKSTAGNILQSLKETAIHKEELGTYWMQAGNGYWWYEAPIEAQSLLIECFSEAGDTKMTDELKRWLLKQKQTQNWSTTKATADACYALLLTGSQWLNEEQQVSIKLGDKTIAPATTEAGTGYFKQAFNADEIQAAMGNITLTTSTPQTTNQQINQSTNQPGYGAIYWQYFERYDKITSAATPLSLRKQLFIERNTDRGPVLEEIKAGNELKVGDKVKVRIVLQSDRDMEYLHLKDMRAACFEPTNVLSGYRYQGGLGYYESTRDASSNFFISYLNKGTYVFEYSVNVMAKGTFSNGISTIQCMYAPEFSSHSEGIGVVVK